MAHQMEQQMNQNQMEQQVAGAQGGQMGQNWNEGEMSPMEPWRDETRYAMPRNGAARPGMTPYDMQQQTWEMPGAQMGLNGGMSIPGMGGTGYGGQPSAFEQSQRMKNPVDMETTHNPSNTGDAYQASLRSLLARNVGFFVVVTFLAGTQRMVTWQGILHTVGSDYIVIYQPDYERYISCDFYAIKFVQFHNTTSTPYCASSHTWMAQDI